MQVKNLFFQLPRYLLQVVQIGKYVGKVTSAL